MKMKSCTLLAVLMLAASASAQAAGSQGGHDHHGHGSGEPQKLQLDAGRKWGTDKFLRQAMEGINQAMDGALPLIHKHRFGGQEYQALAATVRQKVAYAVENCRLEPRADAMLHLVIADLLAGAEAMEARDDHARHQGAVRVLQALQAYGKHFQHPGWRAAKG